MKVAVYTIALNEEKFVERWAESCKDADHRFILDTGSTDDTCLIAANNNVLAVQIAPIKPWRFDDARNTALALLPEDVDYCIALDMDEILLPGWREELEKAHAMGITRPRYKYTWSWKEDGTPGLQYGGDKIHTRNGYRWKHPVHEVLVADRIEEVQGWTGVEIHHYPDTSKPRSQYLPLLELSVQEDPYDDRNMFYYARELFFYGQYEKAAKYFHKYLSLPTATWEAERARAYRYLAQCEPENAYMWLTMAIQVDPKRREPFVDMAKLAYDNSDWGQCYVYSKAALKILEKPLDYLCEEFAWGSLPYDLAAISAYHLNQYEESFEFGKLAVEKEPSNTRLVQNLKLYASLI